MADKKPTRRPGAPGGDRLMRRRDSRSDATQGEARKNSAPGKSFSSGKPNSGKPAFKKPPADSDVKSFAPKGARPLKGIRAKARPAPAPVEKTSAFEGERIAKAMARAGVCSRRDAEEWIAAGRIAVNGRVLTAPAVNVTEADKITVDGAPMQARERTRLFLFHKPQGLVTTASDPEGRQTVFAYLEDRHPDLPRLMSVGRLDINTEGLLLLTNDGGLSRTLELPATGWTRRYRVRVHGEIDQARLDELKKGVTVDDVTYAPIEARLERVQGANAWIAMSLTEGKNREVKRVMEHLGLDVTRLIRISYGPFQLGDLAEGVVEEVKLKTLREQLGKSLAELAGADFASPLREATPTEAQEQRERSAKRSRKHVSVLRKERDSQSEKGPRARIERGATADRKGRPVAVERVTPTRRKQTDEEAPSRNARRFDAMRSGGDRKPGGEAGERSGRPARAARGPREERFGREEAGRSDARRAPERRSARFDEQRGQRPPRAAREGGEPRRDARPRGERSFERGSDERPRGRTNASAPRTGERPNPRAGARDEGRFERRPPRRDRDEPRRDTRPDARAPRAAASRDERPRKFDRPREGAEGRPPRSDKPTRSDKPPRAPRSASDRGGAKGPHRSGGAERGAGFGKGPPRGRGGPGRGPGKGPSKGPAKGAPRGPRKPRGE